MKLHVGCAMWTLPAWQGRHLPHPLSPRERLRCYATWCNAVEGKPRTVISRQDLLAFLASGASA
jgi:hypothetical protein